MQTLKPEMRERVLRTAEAVFAEQGYQGATMAGIAARAGVSTGNLYRYFESKDALFYTLFTDELAETLLRRVRERVRSLVLSEDLEALGPDARSDAAALLDFWIEHRAQVIVLLSRAQGSRFESVRERFVDALLRPTVAKLRADAGRPLTKEERLVIATLFENTVRAVVAILERCVAREELERAFAGFWSYQLAGLAGFTRWVVRDDDPRALAPRRDGPGRPGRPR